MTFHQGKPQETKAPCYPEKTLPMCRTCMRWRVAVPQPAEKRSFVIIDASLIATDTCPMHEART